MKTHNKLVRSKIIEGLALKNIPHIYHLAGPEEYQKKLYEKLDEEAKEFIFEPLKKEELADLLEVIEAIKKLHGWESKEIEEIRLKKLKEKGGFDQPIILEES
jgi:predicted house-cleaning noncanonical NTP pyrophosphatase (MazG superfamily)